MPVSHSKSGLKNRNPQSGNKVYMDEKAKYLTTINNIEEMEMSLLNCNV